MSAIFLGRYDSRQYDRDLFESNLKTVAGIAAQDSKELISGANLSSSAVEPILRPFSKPQCVTWF